MRHILTLPVTARTLPAFRNEHHGLSHSRKGKVLTFYRGHSGPPLERDPCVLRQTTDGLSESDTLARTGASPVHPMEARHRGVHSPLDPAVNRTALRGAMGLRGDLTRFLLSHGDTSL